MDMNFTGSRLNVDILITKLYTVHYFEYSKDYKFSGEAHDFWEFVYVDKGEITAVAGDNKIDLHQGEIIFHRPNEWHNIIANGVTAANVAIASFECSSPAMDFFCNKVMYAGQEQKNLIAKIISEYTNAFSTPLNNPYTNHLERKSDSPIGSEQLIKQYLCELLIQLIRQGTYAQQRTLININIENTMANTLVNYMLDNLHRSININELVTYINSNKMTVTRTFKNCFGMSPIEYFIHLKIEAAKKYLREDNYNITQIADLLGYSGIHYFSSQFKKTTGMSPTEYSMSAKSISKINDLERTE
jgi:AraC-like DNA-binding protein/mannose-6-phosphate isomerase-like protein (cupin superfamily)